MKAHQHYKLHCKTITPVHIGTGENLASIGDYYTSSNRLYFIDKIKLDQFLDPVSNSAFFELYLSEIKKNVSMSKSDFSVVPFLKENGIELETITSKRELPIITSGYESHKNSQLKLAISQNNKLYLPGSSVKGAIKTALFYNFLLSNPDILRRWNAVIENSLNKRQYLGQWTLEVESDFEQFFRGKKSDYNLLRIEDSPSLTDECKGVCETARFHLYNSNDEMVTWLSEIIVAETSFNLGVTILPEFKTDFLEFLNDADISKLFSIINQFSKDLLKNEIGEIESSQLPREVKSIVIEKLKQLLKMAHNDNQALIRIGAGKSFFYNTVCSLLDKTHLEILRSIVKIGKPDESIFPLTRTMTTDYDLFGWVLMELPTNEIETELPVNDIAEIELNKTELKAMIVGERKVRINLNQTILDVQLVLSMEQKNVRMNKGEIIIVIVKQMSKEQQITQVAYKSKNKR